MVESSNFLIFLIILAIGILIFQYRHFHFKKKIEKHTSLDTTSTIDDKIQNEEEFLKDVAKSYDSYSDFLKSSDCDNYFAYWKSHPKSVEKIKELIESKTKSFFKYKSVKY